jgi:hypothetical protein
MVVFWYPGSKVRNRSRSKVSIRTDLSICEGTDGLESRGEGGWGWVRSYTLLILVIGLVSISQMEEMSQAQSYQMAYNHRLDKNSMFGKTKNVFASYMRCGFVLQMACLLGSGKKRI